MIKKYFKQTPYDVDLYVDRTADIQDDLMIDVRGPSTIRVGEDAMYEIVDYDPSNEYEVTAIGADVTVELPYIHAVATGQAGTDVKIIVKLTARDVYRIVIFPDGTIYFEDGRLSSVDEIMESNDIRLKAYVENMLSQYPNLVKDSFKSDGKPSVSQLNFDIRKIFGNSIKPIRWTDSHSDKKAGINEPFLPHDNNYADSESAFIYETKTQADKKYITFKPRNSNIDEAAGNVNTGYRYKGAQGSSLSIYEGDPRITKIEEFAFPIKLWELIAAMPDDVMALCMTSVEVIPYLIGNREGHVFLWEIISGDPGEITWVTHPEDKDLIINIGDRKLDIKFRFWISKGTEYEKYYDIMIYATPRDIAVVSPIVRNELSVLWDHESKGELVFSSYKTTPILLTARRLLQKDMRLTILED